MNSTDLLVVGGGPIGLACGIAAKQAGLGHVIVEKGCLVNSLYNYPINMTFFSTSDRLEIGNVPFMSLNAKPTRPEALEYYRRVVQLHRLNLRLFEAVVAVQPNADSTTLAKGYRYVVTTSKQRYNCKSVAIATGFYDVPNALGVPGEDLPKVTHYYRDPAYYAFQQVLVVGANNSAVDAALECWRKGAGVTMVVREAEIGSRVKYWARPDIVNRIAEGSIKAYFNSTVASIDAHKVSLQTPDGLIHIPNDFVLAMTGYQPNFDLLARWGVQCQASTGRQPVHNALTMETTQPGLYLAGVVCGGMDTHLWFIENSRDHAYKIVQHILQQSG
ncbi:MAG: YpdA family putative bacillithiol disulfide reductase [Bacteroidetes bacterium]|nr:MAG: YpdA family putative bacillithiol disulfide reductase [Bacteroidota bacterium]